ncbi:hypothetical protein M407DRAFT_24360 [Tulasnella calospora MUT 4182]|uniref:XLF-like N-terminal domain-containing protein n=1 Tax=Tulasnella calospora MUT 4182 TaxID=1051891 RepID=A0A0C3LY95_9AGAM|nr:hypothetical protein M407DRAFT_24360 [Tulasnella calospora MUT 4182]
MLDFEESHSKALLNSPWLCKIHESTAYLFKCQIQEDDQSCCFIITDTERVWTEILHSRHISRRAVQCSSSAADVDYDEEAEGLLIKRNLVILHNLHRPEAVADADFSIGPSKRADLEVTLNLEDFTWRWDAMSLGSRQAAKLLSVHLITPLISFAAMSTFIDEPLREISASSLTRAADSQAKTAKRSLAHHRRAAKSFAYPSFGGGLRPGAPGTSPAAGYEPQGQAPTFNLGLTSPSELY